MSFHSALYRLSPCIGARQCSTYVIVEKYNENLRYIGSAGVSIVLVALGVYKYIDYKLSEAAAMMTAGLTAKIEVTQSKIDATMTKIDATQTIAASLKNRVESINARLNTIDLRLAKMDERILGLEEFAVQTRGTLAAHSVLLVRIDEHLSGRKK